MELSAELFQSTVKSLKGDPVEKRAHPRAPARFKLHIIPLQHIGTGGMIDVWTRDISRAGLGVTSSINFPVGMRFIVKLPRSIGIDLCLLCTVKSCLAQSKTHFVIGASFVEVDIATLPKPTPKAPPKPMPVQSEVERISQVILG